MEFLEFGHGGAKIIAFPTSGGRFWEWEDRGMVAAIRHQLEHGWFQLYLVDTVDSESWYNDHAHPGGKIWRQVQYDAYLRDELLPFMNWRNGHPFVVTAGASFGAYHALSFGLRHPDRVNRILSMSGLCDIKRFARGFYNDLVYFHNPVDFIAGESDGYRLHHLRQQDIILAVGKDDGLLHQNRELSGKLWNKGIGNALREWDGFAHDWPVWYKMLNLYVGGHD
jgi:esterase/lipase superfamily enzyme